MTAPASSERAPEDSTPAAAPRWTRWFTAAAVALGLVALAITVWTVGPGTLADQLATIGVGFVAVLAIEVAVTACDAAALSGFLGPGGRRPSYLHVLRAQVIGRAINVVTPLASLGEATKATTLMARTSSARAVGAVLHYNLATLAVRLMTIAIGAPLCALLLDVPRGLTLVLIGGGGGAAVLVGLGVVLVRRGMLASVVGALRVLRLVSTARAERWRARLAEVDRRLRGAGTPRQRWTPIGWTVLSRIGTLLSAWAVLVAMGHHVGVGTLAAISTAGQLITVASSLVPLGLGLAEAGNAALFAALGEPASLGVAMVLGTRITLVAYAALGLGLMGTTTVLGSRR